jgi:hypothetical protein
MQIEKNRRSRRPPHLNPLLDAAYWYVHLLCEPKVKSAVLRHWQPALSTGMALPSSGHGQPLEVFS